MWCIYNVECYSVIINNELMKFLAEQMDLENIIQSEVPKNKEHSVYALTDK